MYLPLIPLCRVRLWEWLYGMCTKHVEGLHTQQHYLYVQGLTEGIVVGLQVFTFFSQQTLSEYYYQIFS